MTDDFKNRVRLDNPYSQACDYFGRADSDALLNRMLYADVKTCLQELLMKQDQMSMATSVESRVPFLDHPLVEFTAKLPVHLKLRYGWITKYILRRAMAGVLPESILSRRKMGFPVPIGKWFRGAFRGVIDEYVLGGRALSRGLFDADFVRQLVARHQAGENHADRLWSLLTLEMWLRRFIDGDQSHHAPVPRLQHVVTRAPRRSYQVIAT